jgi:hypothetical protein
VIGTVPSLSVTGNINTGNLLTGGVVSAVGNIRGGNINTDGLISTSGNIRGANLAANTLSLSGNVLSAINSTSNVNFNFGQHHRCQPNCQYTESQWQRVISN